MLQTAVHTQIHTYYPTHGLVSPRRHRAHQNCGPVSCSGGRLPHRIPLRSRLRTPQCWKQPYTHNFHTYHPTAASRGVPRRQRWVAKPQTLPPQWSAPEATGWGQGRRLFPLFGRFPVSNCHLKITASWRCRRLLLVLEEPLRSTSGASGALLRLHVSSSSPASRAAIPIFTGSAIPLRAAFTALAMSWSLLTARCRGTSTTGQAAGGGSWNTTRLVSVVCCSRSHITTSFGSVCCCSESTTARLVPVVCSGCHPARRCPS